MKILEIVVPFVLIVILLSCMMTKDNDGYSVGGRSCKLPALNSNAFSVGGEEYDENDDEEYDDEENDKEEKEEDAFNVGGASSEEWGWRIDDKDGFSVGCSACQSGDGFNVGGESDKICKVTMIWADWCGYSNKAKPEWDNLVKEYQGKNVNGYKLHLNDAEEKINPETVKQYSPDGFPTYFVELNDNPGQRDEFNSIKKDDMFNKIKTSISKLSGSNVKDKEDKIHKAEEYLGDKIHKAEKYLGDKIHGAEKYLGDKIHGAEKYLGDKIHHTDHESNNPKPVVSDQILYANCNDSLQYGPISLKSVDHNLKSGSAPNILNGFDCTDLDFAPVKFALSGSQIPNMNNIPALAQLQTPEPEIIRPHSFQKTHGSSDKIAKVTMVWADWCGYSNKAKPEWDELKSEMNEKNVSGCKINMRDLEHKKDENEIKENYSDVEGFPTYVVEVTDSSGKLIKKQSFNSIEKNDMQQKLEAILSGI